ncbi:MAG: hypothetical protein RSC72_11135 [Algoriella sp.]|uniref:hypothetical protein n=1 Tax=Algoriella sp. TaxID=1872434 RepID=UPI002FC6ECE7
MYKTTQSTRSKSNKNIPKSDMPKVMKEKQNTKLFKSFKNGRVQLKKESFKPFKDEVMMFLSTNSDSTYFSIQNGSRPMSLSEMRTIERIFKKHGVTQNIWSDPT